MLRQLDARQASAPRMSWRGYDRTAFLDLRPAERSIPLRSHLIRWVARHAFSMDTVIALVVSFPRAPCSAPSSPSLWTRSAGRGAKDHRRNGALHRKVLATRKSLLASPAPSSVSRFRPSVRTIRQLSSRSDGGRRQIWSCGPTDR